MDGFLDVSLDVAFGLSIGLFAGLGFGRNTCSGYTTALAAGALIVGVARHARI
jgi:hypothetical protein